MRYCTVTTPHLQEITDFLETAFKTLSSQDNQTFPDELDQTLAEWFDTSELLRYLPYGQLIEARSDQDELAGLTFIGQQNPITWPDGHKLELFVLAVSPQFRGQGIGGQLIKAAEAAAKELGGKSIIINTHVLMSETIEFYQKRGYKQIGVLQNYYDNGDAVFFLKKLSSVQSIDKE